MSSNYKSLLVWQKSFAITKEIYNVTKNFPKEELFVLTSQMRRCSVSIPSNIAEGKGRHSDKELIRFLRISKGSCNELETQILLAKEIGYISEDISKKLENNCQEILKMISVLIKKLKAIG